MARLRCVLVFFVSLLTKASASAGRVSPIEKVIQMIGDLQQKIIKEGEVAQKTYAEFAEWCEEESKSLHFEIKTAKAELEDLNAVLEKASADIDAEETKIGELSGTLATDEADLKAATSIREKEAADFAAEEKELMDTVSSLERAVAILERELKAGSSFVQLKDAGNLVHSLSVLVQGLAISSSDMEGLTAMLQSQENSDDAFGTNAKGGVDSIMDTLNDLLDKAESQLEEARKKETTAKQNYEMLKMELEDAIKFAQTEMDKSKKRKAEDQETKATAEGDIATVEKDLKEDVTRLEGVHHDCMTKASDFEIETQSRAEELKALATAKKIIIEKVALAQTTMSFLQLKSRTTMRSDDAEGVGQGVRAEKFMRELGRKLGSRAFTQLADRVSAALRFNDGSGDDPFVKIKGMINTMIEKLLKEAEEEAGKKAYCDKEMGETKKSKGDLEDEIDDLTAKIDKMSAEAKTLKEESAVLSKELVELAKSQAEMEKIRQEEHEEFVKNKEELDEGIEGIQLALKVLREYYAKDGSFLQGSQQDAHSPASGAGAGIIGMLEVAESDMQKNLEEILSTEETSQAEFDKTTKENEVAKATKEQDVKYKTKEFKSLEKAAAEATSDREGVQTELDAVLEYYEKLKPKCITEPEPYEERKKRREAEIAGLKEALQILEGEAVFLQLASSRRTVRHLRHTV